jgi:hypothetical protein
MKLSDLHDVIELAREHRGQHAFLETIASADPDDTMTINLDYESVEVRIGDAASVVETAKAHATTRIRDIERELTDLGVTVDANVDPDEEPEEEIAEAA